MNTNPHKISVLLADPQYLTGIAIESLFKTNSKYELLRITRFSDELLELHQYFTPDLLIIDPEIFETNYIQNTADCKSRFNNCNILVFTSQLNTNDINEFTCAGIKNIIYKDVEEDEFWEALSSTIKGKKFYSDHVFEMLLKSGSQRNPTEENIQLTSSEIEIVKLIGNGLTSKEIASIRNLSYHTISTHRKNIFKKLNINNTSELIMYAVRNQIINDLEYYI